jgi:exosome complex component RRP4
MSNETSKARSRVVVPGDLLDGTGKAKPGSYTYITDGKIYAGRLGILREGGGFLNIIPLSGVYNPAPGDVIIGIVQELGPSNWMVDINAPYPAPMHASETPWDVEFGETAEFLRAGDTILCKVLFVDETKKVQVTMKDPSLRKLEGGQVLEIDASRVARVIGKQGSMVATIKKYTDVWMFVGQNGRIWVNGEMPMIQAAIDAIRLIESEAHKPGLTQKVESFLKEATGRDPNAQMEAEAN